MPRHRASHRLRAHHQPRLNADIPAGSAPIPFSSSRETDSEARLKANFWHIYGRLTLLGHAAEAARVADLYADILDRKSADLARLFAKREDGQKALKVCIAGRTKVECLGQVAERATESALMLERAGRVEDAAGIRGLAVEMACWAGREVWKEKQAEECCERLSTLSINSKRITSV